MKNLFVLHTQYNLIIATGLVQSKFNNAINDLILFQDFELKEDMKKKLDSIFNSTLYLKGSYPLINTIWRKKIFIYPKVIKSCFNFIISKYERVYLVDDGCLPEIYIMKKAYSLNRNINFLWLEDGSYPYFLNHETSGGFDSNEFTRNMRKFIFKYIFGCGQFYSFEGRFMGANTWIKTILLTYPNYAREIYKNKEKEEISSDSFFLGLGIFDRPNCTIKKNSVVILFDKLNVYKDKQSISLTINSIVKDLQSHGITVYYKYHPRETSVIPSLSNDCIELNRNKGIEAYCPVFLEANCLIIGIKSTGLQSSQKIGVHTVSIANLVNESNKDMDLFYEKIGIKQINSMNDLKKCLALFEGSSL
jgi:hypothetical protein